MGLRDAVSLGIVIVVCALCFWLGNRRGGGGSAA